jgi:Leucine-rich repeat (LRR) protein
MKVYYIVVFIFIIFITSCSKTSTNSSSYEPVPENNTPIEQPIIIGGYAENYTLSHHRKYFNDFSVRIGENRSVDFSGIEQMKHIKTLTIIIWENNNLIDFSPIKLLQNIEKIILRGTGHTAIPDIGEIKSLKRLELDRTGITNLDGIEKITSLEHLQISGNREKITDVSALRFLNNIKQIIFHNGYYNIDFSVLAELRKLEELAIGGCIGVDLTGISKLKSLKNLFLRSNILKEIDERSEYQNIQEIGNMYWLTELLIDEYITSVEFLANCVNLERLELIADEERRDFGFFNIPLDISPLRNLVNLKYLAIRGFEIENEDLLLDILPGVDRIWTGLYSSSDDPSK